MKKLFIFFILISLFFINGCSKNEVFNVDNPVIETSGLPVFSYDSGTYYPGTIAPEISCDTIGATIVYTTDGTDPRTSGTATSVLVTQVHPLVTVTFPTLVDHTTIKAYTYKTGVFDSTLIHGVTTRQYNMVKADQPIFSNGSGTYITDVSFDITSATLDVDITYEISTDGGSTWAPAVTGDEPINLTFTENTVIRAYAFRSAPDPNPHYANSDTVTQTYLVKVATPGFDQGSGPHNDSIVVKRTIATPGATVRYTLTDNGTNPAEPTAASPVYPNPAGITVTKNDTRIYIKAFKNNCVDSDSYLLAFYLKVQTPQVSHSDASPYNNEFTLTANTPATSGDSLYYTVTTDGSVPADPTTASTPYPGGGLLINQDNTKIKIRSFKTDYQNSDITYNTYRLKCATPTISVPTGTYNNDQIVNITCPAATPGAKILYTTDGSAPSHDGSGNPTGTTTAGLPDTDITNISVTSTGTVIRAIAYKANYQDSNQASATYTLTCADPVITYNTSAPGSENFPEVTITTTTTGASIKYTYTDPPTVGMTPADPADPAGNPVPSGTDYLGAPFIFPNVIANNRSVRIKAIVYKAGYNNSSIISNDYYNTP